MLKIAYRNPYTIPIFPKLPSVLHAPIVYRDEQDPWIMTVLGVNAAGVVQGFVSVGAGPWERTNCDCRAYYQTARKLTRAA